jgi:hypothetical protein
MEFPASIAPPNAKDQRLAALGSAITHDDARESFASCGSPCSTRSSNVYVRVTDKGLSSIPQKCLRHSVGERRLYIEQAAARRNLSPGQRFTDRFDSGDYGLHFTIVKLISAFCFTPRMKFGSIPV